MSVDRKMQQMVEEIELFIQYAVQESELKQSIALVNKYKDNSNALRLFREYYSALPEAREEPVARIAKLISRQGVDLFVVATPSFSYLYLLSADHVVLLGEYKKEVDDAVLSFFGFQNQEAFLKTCLPVADLEEYSSVTESENILCPACGVAEGEYHLLGCAVEVCPWCDGQLSKCNCRFEQLDTEEIEGDEQLEVLLERLMDKGRIAYNKKQAPAYPGSSDGLDAKGD